MYIPPEVLFYLVEIIVVGIAFWLGCNFFAWRAYKSGIWEGMNTIINSLVEKQIVTRNPNGRIVRYYQTESEPTEQQPDTSPNFSSVPIANTAIAGINTKG